MMRIWLLVTSLTSAVSGSDTASLCSSLSPCSRPLGLESGHLPDLAITASSSYSSSVEARMGRLNSEEGGGAWCPSSVLTNSSQEWLQLDLGRELLVTGLISQGRWDRGLGQEWATSLQVQLWDGAAILKPCLEKARNPASRAKTTFELTATTRSHRRHALP